VTKKVKILMMADISGEGIEYHVGDEAMAEVAITRLKNLVGAENLVMACAHPEGVPATYGIPAIGYYSTTNTQRKKLIFQRPLSFIKGTLSMIHNLMKCDALFICGGGNLTSEWPGVLESRMRMLKWAVRFKKKVFLVSQTLGPYTDEHRSQINPLLASVTWIGVRDKHYSHKQITSEVKYAVDDASYLAPSHSDYTLSLVQPDVKRLAFSMRKFGRANESLLVTLSTEVARISKERHWQTIFIPHHAPANEGDIRIAKDNAHFWSDQKPLVITAPIPLAAPLKALTGECELTVSMRYHQIIFALSMGIPVVGIYVNEYTQAKLHGAFEQFGLEPRLISIEQVTSKLETLINQVLSEKLLFEEAKVRIATNEVKKSMIPYNKVASV